MTHQDDRLSLEVWVPAMSAYQHVEIFPRDQPKEIKVAGKVLGTFPRTGDERFSWVLEREDDDLRAYRTEKKGELKSRLLRGLVELYACQCGIVSIHASKNAPHCFRCNNRERLLGHHCKRLPRSPWVATNLKVCMFCGVRASLSSSMSGQQPDGDLLEMTDSPSNGDHSGTAALGGPTLVQSIGGRGNKNGRGLIIGLLVPFGFLVAVLAMVLADKVSEMRTISTYHDEIEAAIADQRILLPVFNSLTHYCSSLTSPSPRSELRNQLWSRCISRISESINEALASIYADLRVDQVNWVKLRTSWEQLVAEVCSKSSPHIDLCDKFRATRELLAGEAEFQKSGGEDSERTTVALRHFSEAGRLDPDWSFPHYRLGEVYFRQSKMIPRSAERRELAKVCLRRALHLEPALGIFHYRLGRVFLSEGDVDQAIWHIQNAALAEPRNKWLQRERLESLAADDRCDEVRAVRDSVGEYEPTRRLAREIHEEACE